MKNNHELDCIYKEYLENDIIKYLSEQRKIDIRTAMDIYYKSTLSKQISANIYGIENMDYKYLAKDLMDNERELFNENR